MLKIVGANSSNLLTYGRIMIESRVSASILNQHMLVPPHAHCKSRKIKKTGMQPANFGVIPPGSSPKRYLASNFDFKKNE